MPSGAGGKSPSETPQASGYSSLTTHRAAAAGTNPIHNKQKKKAAKAEDDEEDTAYKAKQMAGT